VTSAASFHRFANPARFQRIGSLVLPWLFAVTALLLLPGLWLALVASPPDYQQGDTVRIMYVHVPAAWMSLFVYTSMAVSAAVGLVWKHPLAEVYAKAAAPVGAGFTALCLATGSLWGEPMWGTWWQWDARMTSVLVLFFLYLGYVALVDAFDEPARGAKAGAILLIVGVVNVPIIKFSVDWWNTLHQPASVFRLDGPTIHSSMLWPLGLMALGFTTWFAAVVIVRMKAELADRRIRALRIARIARD
jgi:heme exporter protein C